MVVTVSSQSSSPYSYNYGAPVILSKSALSYPTGGGSVLTIDGYNFGTSGSITVGGWGCSPTAGGWGQTVLTCLWPSGQGINLALVVSVASQASNTAIVSYGIVNWCMFGYLLCRFCLCTCLFGVHMPSYDVRVPHTRWFFDVQTLQP